MGIPEWFATASAWIVLVVGVSGGAALAACLTVWASDRVTTACKVHVQVIQWFFNRKKFRAWLRANGGAVDDPPPKKLPHMLLAEFGREITNSGTRSNQAYALVEKYKNDADLKRLLRAAVVFQEIVDEDEA